MNVYVDTVDGTFAVDLETEEIEPASAEFGAGATVELPRVIAAARESATIVAVVDAKPPLMISHDAGTTWRGSGRGLPKGRAVAIATDNPDLMVYASRNRLHVSYDGGRFWRTLDLELPEIRNVEF